MPAAPARWSAPGGSLSGARWQWRSPLPPAACSARPAEAARPGRLKLSNDVSALLSDENRQAFASAVADIAVVAHTVAVRKNALDSGIVHAARTFENTSLASAQIRPLLDRLGRSADAVEKMGQAVARTSASAGKTVDSLGADAQRFTDDVLPELERLLGELSVLSTALRRLGEQTERNPASLLFGRRPVPEGPGESTSTGARQR